MFCEGVIVGESDTYIEGNPESKPLLFVQIVYHSPLYLKSACLQFSTQWHYIFIATGLIRVKTQNSKSAGDMKPQSSSDFHLYV
jgi:hypothetical protein